MRDRDKLEKPICELSADQRERWLRRERVLAEKYLTEHVDLFSCDQSRVEFIYSEFCLRAELGDSPSPQEYVRRFPKLAAQLMPLLKSHPSSTDCCPAGTQQSDPLANTADLGAMDPGTIDLGTAGNSAPADAHTMVWSDTTPNQPDGPRPLRTAATDGSVGMPTSAGYRFRKLHRHDGGGLGDVFLAYDEELHREVALKEIRRGHDDNPTAQTRFVREAEITGGLEHPGIVPVYGLGAYADGRPYYAMRFIKGHSLKRAIQQFHQAEGPDRDPGQRALELRDLLGRFIQVCNALAYAHSRGVVHRDIKPDNVMLGEFGETLVIDWGLAKPLDQPDESETTLPPPTLSGSGSAALTQMHQIVGTVYYMSPEQAAGRLDLLGTASDVYSLAATLYNLLTGATMFNETTVSEACEKLRRGDFLRPRQVNRQVPAALEAICLKGLKLKPEDRYPSAKALAADVEHWLADEPVSAYREPMARRVRRWTRRHRTAVSAVGGLCGAVVVLGALWGYQEVSRDQDVRLRAQRELWAGTEAQKNGELTTALARFTEAGARAQERPRLAALWAEATERRQDVEKLLNMRRDFEQFKNRATEQLREAKFHTLFDDSSAGRDICRGLLAEFDAQDWSHKLNEGSLDARAIQQCRQDVAESIVLLARVEVDLADDRQAALQQAVERLGRAEAVRGKPTRALCQLRSLCYAELGRGPLAKAEAERAAATPATGAFDHFLQAENLRRQGKLPAAADEYRQALDKEPDHFWSHNMLAVCFMQLEQPLQALGSYDQAIRLRPTFAPIYAARALASADLGQWNAALADLAKAEELDARFYGIYNNRGVVLYTQALSPREQYPRERRLELLTLAAAELERCRAKNSKFSGAFNNLGNVQREQAVLLGKAGDADAAHDAQRHALRSYTQALELYAHDRRAQVNRGITYARAGEYDSALADLQGALRENQDDLDAHFGLGSLHEERGRARTRSGDAATAARDLQDSIEHYGRVVRGRPASPGAYLGRARARYELLQLALRTKKVQVAPTDPKAIETDLNFAERLGGNSLTSDDLAALHAMRGVVRSYQNNYQGALADYDSALTGGAERPSLRLRRGWALALGREHALADFQAALERPEGLDVFEVADVHNGRGYVLALAGQDRDAVRDAEEAVKLAPDQWEVLFNAAAIYGLATGVARIERSDAELAKQYAQQTVRLLKRAIAAGLSDKKVIRQDRSFVHLQQDQEFQHLLE